MRDDNECMNACLLTQAILRDAQATGDSSYTQFRSEVTDLRKFVVLNYIAVIKAFKKRNRHLQVTHALHDTCASQRLFAMVALFPSMLVAVAADHATHAFCAIMLATPCKPTLHVLIPQPCQHA